MKNLAHIIILLLLVVGVGCQGDPANKKDGYGTGQRGLGDDGQGGNGAVDQNSSSDVSVSGGTMQNTATDTTMHNPVAVGESQAASATGKTKQEVGNSNTSGEANTSLSKTTPNKVIKE